MKEVRAGIGGMLFTVAVVGLILGSPATMIMGIVRLIAAVFHFALPVPFWPFPAAVGIGFLALFLFSHTSPKS